MNLSPKTMTLEYNSYYLDDTLYLGWNSGFFSNLSVCLWNLATLWWKYNITPTRIDFSKAFFDFKTEKQREEQADIYPLLFKPTEIRLKKRGIPRTNHHTLYKETDIKPLTQLVKRYFGLAFPVKECQRDILSKYKLDASRTIAVCMRGTDKSKEIQNAGCEAYGLLCEKILQDNPHFNIWIQSDQAQYVEYFLKKFSGKAFAVEELPVSFGSIVLHKDPSLGINRIDFAQKLLAIMELLSKCNTVITHTGNVGYWLALFREDLHGFYQDTTHFFKKTSMKKKGCFNKLPFWYYPILNIRDKVPRKIKKIIKTVFQKKKKQLS